MLVPMHSSTGRARSRSAAAPPTMMVSAAFMAPSDPPETGASRNATPPAASSAAISRVASGLMVDMSTTSAPGSAPWITPVGPRSTARTSGVSLTMVMMISAPWAASRGEPAATAPWATTGSIRFGVRLKTVTWWPPLRMFTAMGPPMVPSPMKPTRIMNSPSRLGDAGAPAMGNGSPRRGKRSRRGTPFIYGLGILAGLRVFLEEEDHFWIFWLGVHESGTREFRQGFFARGGTPF